MIRTKYEYNKKKGFIITGVMVDYENREAPQKMGAKWNPIQKSWDKKWTPKEVIELSRELGEFQVELGIINNPDPQGCLGRTTPINRWILAQEFGWEFSMSHVEEAREMNSIYQKMIDSIVPADLSGDLQAQAMKIQSIAEKEARRNGLLKRA